MGNRVTGRVTGDGNLLIWACVGIEYGAIIVVRCEVDTTKWLNEIKELIEGMSSELGLMSQFSVGWG